LKLTRKTKSLRSPNYKIPGRKKEDMIFMLRRFEGKKNLFRILEIFVQSLSTISGSKLKFVKNGKTLKVFLGQNCDEN
jgi:hypothetical protein